MGKYRLMGKYREYGLIREQKCGKRSKRQATCFHNISCKHIKCFIYLFFPPTELTSVRGKVFKYSVYTEQKIRDRDPTEDRVGPKLAGKIEQWTNDDPLKYVVKQSSVMKFNLVSDIFILNSIKQLKNGKAPGPDKFPTMLIKDAAEVICEPLAMIFNSSLRHGIFPDIWKLARVTPIFKSGSRGDANNYRPISVISVFSRILERIVHDQMYD